MRPSFHEARRENHVQNVQVFLDQKKRAWFSTCVRSFVCYRESRVVKGTKTQPVEEKINACHSWEPQNVGVIVFRRQKPPGAPWSRNSSSALGLQLGGGNGLLPQALDLLPLLHPSPSIWPHSEIETACQREVAEFTEFRLHPQIPLLLPTPHHSLRPTPMVYEDSRQQELRMSPRIGFAPSLWKSLTPFL